MNQCPQAWTSERLWPRVFSPVDFWQTPKNIQRRRLIKMEPENTGPPGKRKSIWTKPSYFQVRVVNLRGGLSLQNVEKLRIFFFLCCLIVIYGQCCFSWVVYRMLYNINQQSEPNFFSLICILRAPYIHAQTKGKGLVLSKLLQIWVSQIMDHPRSGWRLRSVLFGVRPSIKLTVVCWWQNYAPGQLQRENTRVIP